MTDEVEDTGVLAFVPAHERLDADGGDGSDALYGGPDDWLVDVFLDPGDVVEESLG